MENRYENMYGKLFRSYAKSIIEEISRIEGLESPNLLTIGILQYRSYDNVFHYAPTLKNVFVFPDDKIMNGNFPTNNHHLWDYKLIVSLAKYFYSIRENEWIEEIFNENEQLEKNSASIFAASFPDYNKFRGKWKDWFSSNVDKFKNISEKDTTTLNQLFYFTNYLISIVKWSAYINKNPESYAENIYICVNIFEYAKNIIKNAEDGMPIFDLSSASFENGIHQPWKNNPSSKYSKSSLLFVLEVCFKQPFNISQKVKIIEDVISKNNNTDNISYINFVAKPLFKAGEFLGIAYITWQSEDEEKSKMTYSKITNIITEILRCSKISRLLYDTRTSAAKFYLQKINSNKDIEKSTIQKVFDFSHIFSSAHLVAFIKGDNLYIKFLIKKDNDHFEYKQYKHKKTKDDLFSFLHDTVVKNRDSLNNHVLWIDIAKNEIENEQDCKEYYNAVSPDITNFDNQINKFIDDADFKCGLFYQITDITVHKFDYEGEMSYLIFFNSNFFQLFNYRQLSKQVHAYNMYHCINKLIEDENAYRTIYIQRRDSMLAMNLDILHHVKNTLKSKYGYILDKDKSGSKSIELLKKNNDKLVERLKKYLTVHKIEKADDTLAIYEIEKEWNKKRMENDNNEIISIIESTLGFSDEKIKSSQIIFDYIFEELISNAIQRGNTSMPIKLSLDINIENELVTFSINNCGSTIPPDKRDVLGRRYLSGSADGSGMGFIIVQSLLKKFGAVENINDRLLNFNMIYNDNEPVSFQFQFQFQKLLI